MARFYVTATSGATGGGDVDSSKFVLITESPYWSHTLWMDSAAGLPDTFNFVYTADPWIQGAEVGFEDSDTLMVYWKPQDTAFEALNLDHIYFQYHVTDSAGSGDTATFEVHYWLRLIEEY